MNIAIATCHFKPDLIPTEKFLLNSLSVLGKVQPATWNDSKIQWEAFDLVIIRSTWDYHEHLDEFNLWLTNLEAKHVKVLNPIEILRGNIHKFYLKELQDNDLPIISTYFLQKALAEGFSLVDLCKAKGWASIVVKPAVSCGAWHTYKLEGLDKIEQFRFPVQSDWLIQPFVPEILENGEVSLMFFNKQYSHAVVKKAKTGDFRVQEEFGGQTELFLPPSQVVSAAQKVVDYYKTPMLYSRIDGVITQEGFKIMEVELIEPELFLLDPSLQNKFTEAILQNL